MADAPTSPKHLPLTAGLVRSATEVPVALAGGVSAFAASLADAVAAVVGGLCPSAPRVSVEAIGEQAELPPAADLAAVSLVSERGPLACFLSADRSFVLALCDLSFGGTGLEPPVEADDRPPSKVEMRLRKRVLDELGVRLPALLGQAFGVSFARPEAGTEVAAPTRDFASIRLLVTAFGYSGEIGFLTGRRNLLAQAAGLGGGATANGTIEPQLGETTIAVRALLAPEAMAIGRIAALRPGQFIRLAATVDAPISIESEGVALLAGTLVSGGEHIAIRISGTAV